MSPFVMIKKGHIILHIIIQPKKELFHIDVPLVISKMRMINQDI